VTLELAKDVRIRMIKGQVASIFKDDGDGKGAT
jgi:hypothetical protein